MPSYRGVEQSAIVKSITDAIEFLETHSTGPECQKLIDRLRTPDAATGVSPLGAIAHAATNKELASAIRGSGAGWLFGATGEVLQFHAVYNTDGKGLDIVERLYQWGAGAGARTLAYNKIDEECDAWLAMSYARKVGMTEENLEKLAGVADALTQNKVALGHAFKAITQLVEMGAAGADDDAMRQLFLTLDLHERHVAKGTLSTVTLDGAQANLEFDRPMSQYGIVMEDMTAGRTGWDDPKVLPVVEKISEILDPFRETDEVSRTGVGIITKGPYEEGKTPQGIIFGSTARVAQAVADAFPELKVIDYEGRKIAPNTLKPQGPKPGFRL
ncbi:MAG: hypothetical protein EPN97_00725 [Alphaproteobacteria bacterium]|nr:MAG: hypothetical protein EPN97_00725 [Alphaproteobacteria bacterium]